MIKNSSYKLIAKYNRHDEYDVITLQVKLNNFSEILIFSGPIDRDMMRDWVGILVEHQDDEFPFEIKNEESLASAVKRLYNELDPEINEDDFEKLYNYRCIHDLSLGNRGIETPKIIIGKKKGRLTISKGNKSYQINDFNCLLL